MYYFIRVILTYNEALSLSTPYLLRNLSLTVRTAKDKENRSFRVEHKENGG